LGQDAICRLKNSACVAVAVTNLTMQVLCMKYAKWRIYFFNKLSKLTKSALLVSKLTIGTTT
jgi:hypothetical protein